MGGPYAEAKEHADVFSGIEDPWGSDGEPEASDAAAAVGQKEVRVAESADRANDELDALSERLQATEALVLERWATARKRDDEFLLNSSMITCMPLPLGFNRFTLPRGYSATWGLEVLREGERWRVRAAGRGFKAGDVVERCPLLPLSRPEDDDEAICRYMCLWNEEAVWTKEHAKKLPEVREQKLAELQLHQTQALKLHRVVRPGGSAMYYPLGFAHLYADAEKRSGVPPAAAELRIDVEAKEAVVVALREISPGEDITLNKRPPVKMSPEAAAALAAAAPPPPALRGPNSLAPCSGYVVARPSGLHGKGAFAAAGYAIGSAVEVCPALMLDGPAALYCADYAMCFGGNCGASSVLPLGCGALYNHVSGPGATPLAWAYDEELELIVLRADHDVEADSELLIDYGSSYWGSRGVEPAL